jgi:hypothetical protein
MKYEEEIHEFDKSLAWGESMSDEPFWKEIYTQAFPTMVNLMKADGDTLSQRMGIDRIIILANGEIIKIDEKKRATVYPDILLEYISVDTTNAPGWIEKDLSIDYLAYAFMPTKRVYLFPWLLLRKAWIKHKEEWVKTYKTIEAQNRNYVTISKAIPINVLMKAVARAGIIQL